MHRQWKGRLEEEWQLQRQMERGKMYNERQKHIDRQEDGQVNNETIKQIERQPIKVS